MSNSFTLAIIVIFVLGLWWWSTTPNNYYSNDRYSNNYTSENYVSENALTLPRTQNDVATYMVNNNPILAADNGAFELLGIPDESTEQQAYNLAFGMGTGIYQTMGSRAESPMW